MEQKHAAAAGDGRLRAIGRERDARSVCMNKVSEGNSNGSCIVVADSIENDLLQAGVTTRHVSIRRGVLLRPCARPAPMRCAPSRRVASCCRSGKARDRCDPAGHAARAGCRWRVCTTCRHKDELQGTLAGSFFQALGMNHTVLHALWTLCVRSAARWFGPCWHASSRRGTRRSAARIPSPLS